jgi:hypothetical protein
MCWTEYCWRCRKEWALGHSPYACWLGDAAKRRDALHEEKCAMKRSEMTAKEDERAREEDDRTEREMREEWARIRKAEKGKGRADADEMQNEAQAMRKERPCVVRSCGWLEMRPKTPSKREKYVKCSRCAFEYCWLCRKRWQNFHAVVGCRPHGLQDWEREMLKKGLKARTKRERDDRLSQIEALTSSIRPVLGCGLLVARLNREKAQLKAAQERQDLDDLHVETLIREMWPTREKGKRRVGKKEKKTRRREERLGEIEVLLTTKKCPGPNCGYRVERWAGFGWMTCTQCRRQFCWVCLSLRHPGHLSTTCAPSDSEISRRTNEKRKLEEERAELLAEQEREETEGDGGKIEVYGGLHDFIR